MVTVPPQTCDKPFLAILAWNRPPYIMWNEFTSCRNAYAEMILWHDSFSAKTHVLEKSLIPVAAELFSFLFANGRA